MIESIFFNPWIWINTVVLLVAVIGGLYLLRTGLKKLKTRGSYSREGEGRLIASGVVGTLILFLAPIHFGWVLPPYDASFYQTYRITGELSEIQSAFSGDEGTMSQVFVAKVDGVDLYIRSDDQRFRTLEAGDDVNLVCGKGFAYFQEPWYDCSFGGAR